MQFLLDLCKNLKSFSANFMCTKLAYNNNEIMMKSTCLHALYCWGRFVGAILVSCNKVHSLDVLNT